MATANFTTSNMSRFTQLVVQSNINTINENVGAIFMDGGHTDLELVDDPGNFSVRQSLGTYTVLGTYSEKLEQDSGLPFQASVNWNTITAEVDNSKTIPNGTYQFLGSFKASVNLDTSQAAITIENKGYTFTSSVDHSSWRVGSSAKASLTLDLEAGTGMPSIAMNYSSFTYTADNGDVFKFTGSLTYDGSIDEFTGYVSGISAIVEGITYTSPKINLPVSLFDGGYDVSDLMPYILWGNDTISLATDAKKVLEGFAGNDKITGNDSNNAIYGGGEWENNNSGKDTIFGGLGNDSLYGGDGADSLVAGVGNDFIKGGAGNDKLYGNEGNDTLYSSEGNDLIDGGAGNDWLIGDSQKDTLVGGAGNDVFEFYLEGLTGRYADQLSDFKVGEDKIYLDDANYNRITITASNFDKGTITSATLAGQYYIYNTSNGTLYYDADGNGAGLGIAICTLTGKPNISVSDFYS
jgi:Ca2+-binding RTX toxin-like protein